MEAWTPETVTQRFSQLGGSTDPIFYIEDVDVNDHYLTVVGDAKKGRVNLKYNHPADGKYRTGFIFDRQMQGNDERLYINYGSEEDLMPYSETISIEEALRIAIYFVEYKALLPLPAHLYWEGAEQA